MSMGRMMMSERRLAKKMGLRAHVVTGPGNRGSLMLTPLVRPRMEGAA